MHFFAPQFVTRGVANEKQTRKNARSLDFDRLDVSKTFAMHVSVEAFISSYLIASKELSKLNVSA